ncbi:MULTISPECIES: thiol reductant ABC exporter subunit CydD [unclassified Halomonas]|uniref:thiol reductant ABC exporter subunit CydD n=1 Tax=unclassified Halomonas TaxID=2609666 RepID=UPI0007D9186C|nr:MULTISPECIES: thiol reductant ABC exporter subunit CydD [unclassified Halomonas]MBT2788730.1 thiol reductant ABC exporter subunit CydD [Halomonas sp. ISL-106]MBT2798321.1 thiol reductant ABC exporter subunit CydD [Halomonas sp. ISL-104]OAL60862.1 thiol reductant ABC exporter subunit CydD [Halomonas sp. ALS9]
MITEDALSLTPRSWLQVLAKGERKRLLGAALCGVLAGSQTIVVVVGLAWLIDQLVVQDQSPISLVPMFCLLLACVLLRAAFQWGHETLSLDASLRIRQRARAQLLDKLSALGPVWLTSQHSGSLANQVVEHIDALEGYFARFYPQLRITLCLPLLILAVAGWLDYLVALFLLLSAPLIPLFMALVGMGAERLNRDQFVAVSRLSAHFIDRVRGMTTLQLFGRTSAAQQDVWYATDGYRRLSMRTLRLAFLSSAVLEFFSSVAIAVVAMYVGFGLLGYIEYGPSPSLTLFSGLAVLLLAPEFFQPLRTLSQHYHDRAAALGAAESIVNILNQPSLVSEYRAVAPRSDRSVIELMAACVAYPGRGKVIGPINLTIQRGEVVALSGASGSGKSTLLALLAGFIAPSAGEYRRQQNSRYAWLDQQPCLLHGSLIDNLRLAAPAASREEMLAALHRAGFGPLLTQLPEGLDTLIGERGVGLSGGQAQRLALARVYLSDAPLLLLDEPTASLDQETEQFVLAALLELAHEGRTLVIATHHPAVIAVAQRHFAFEQDELVEVIS